jgi:drug/metabolite transporter (DMT)-like permease
MVSLRLMIAAIGMIGFSRGQCFKFSRQSLSLFFTIGFWLAATFIAQAEGLRGTSVANAAVITALFVVLTPALLWALKKGKPTLFQWLGALIGIFAFFILGYAQGFSKLNIYDGLTFLTAVSVAFHTVYFTEALKHPSNLFPVVFYQFLFSSLIIFFFHSSLSLFSQELKWIPELQSHDWFSLIYLGVCTSAMPYLLQAYAQLSLSPVQALLVISSEPFWAIALAHLIRGDAVSAAALVACGILVIANIVAELRAKQRISA